MVRQWNIFWENNFDRALQFAQELKENPKKGKKPITEPSVIGAVINLGYCLDLVASQSLKIVKAGYDLLRGSMNESEFNSLKNKQTEKDGDLLIRELDCAVIESIHDYNKQEGQRKV